MRTAVEFFSGIGAFSYASTNWDVQVVAAYDQYTKANDTFAHNFKLRPVAKNLDSIKLVDIPESDIWWMSPPCTPFSVRGCRLDVADPRTQPFINLVGFIPVRCPSTIMIENVHGFVNSMAFKSFEQTVRGVGYHVQSLNICSSQFGVPMRRPRTFVLAVRKAVEIVDPEPVRNLSLNTYLCDEDNENEQLFLNEHELTKYGAGFDIVDVDSTVDSLTCFTRNYARCMKASGSLLRLKNGRLRRCSPREILNMLGFGSGYCFPDHVDLQAQWRLVGNSVDTRAIDHLLRTLDPVL